MFFNHKKLKSPFKYLSRGFTLTEVLVIVLIIAVLMAIAYPLYTKTISKARAVEAVNLLEIVRTKQVTQYVRSRSYYNDFESMGQLTNNKSAEHADGTSIKINDYTVTIDNQKECLTAEYDKGGVKFAMSASYSKEGLGCTGDICESFGSVVGKAEDVCGCQNTCPSGYQNPATCECGECNPGTTGICGNCGTKICGDNYHWGSNCSGQGVCSPGTPNGSGCVYGGSKTCTGSCTWGECTGEGVCNPGDTRTCGECGTQTCGSNYQWGSCTEITKTPDDTETCGGTGTRRKSYSCVKTETPAPAASWVAGNWSECECPSGKLWDEDTEQCVCPGESILQPKCVSSESNGRWNIYTNPCACSCGTTSSNGKEYKKFVKDGACVCPQQAIDDCDGKGIFDPSTCWCKCPNNKQMQNGVCTCANTADQAACASINGNWDPDTCLCTCSGSNKIMASDGTCHCKNGCGTQSDPNVCPTQISGNYQNLYFCMSGTFRGDCAPPPAIFTNTGVSAYWDSRPNARSCQQTGGTWNSNTCSCDCPSGTTPTDDGLRCGCDNGLILAEGACYCPNDCHRLNSACDSTTGEISVSGSPSVSAHIFTQADSNVGANARKNSTRCTTTGGTWNGINDSPRCDCNCGDKKEPQADYTCQCNNLTAEKSSCETTIGGEYDETDCECKCVSPKTEIIVSSVTGSTYNPTTSYNKRCVCQDDIISINNGSGTITLGKLSEPCISSGGTWSSSSNPCKCTCPNNTPPLSDGRCPRYAGATETKKVAILGGDSAPSDNTDTFSYGTWETSCAHPGGGYAAGYKWTGSGGGSSPDTSNSFYRVVPAPYIASFQVKTGVTQNLTSNTYNVCNGDITKAANDVASAPPSSVGDHTYTDWPGLLTYNENYTTTGHLWNTCKTSSSTRPMCFGPKAQGASNGDGSIGDGGSNTGWVNTTHSIPTAKSQSSNCSTCFYASTPTGGYNASFDSTSSAVGKVTGCDTAGSQQLSFCSAAVNTLVNANDLDGACEKQNGVACIAGTGASYNYTEYTYPIHKYSLESYSFRYCYKSNASGPTKACGTLINNVCPNFNGWNQVWDSSKWWKRTFYSRKSGGAPSVKILKCTPR